MVGATIGVPLAQLPERPEFFERHGWVGALATLLGAAILAAVVDRVISRRGMKLAEAVARGELTPEAITRLRFVRRLLSAAILVIGIAVALSYFEGLSGLASSLLDSGAIAAAVVGFAARQTLANFIAGIMIALTQPLRVGDWVTIEDAYGVVEDIRLNATVLRTPADQRVVIPNERLAAGILRNDTLKSGSIRLDVAIWLPAYADAARAVALLGELTGGDVSVAESTADGVRLSVGGESVAPPERARREAELRLRCLACLREAGLLAVAP
jgi:small-conductance mechanosensitive channel